jgi:hypothetical protein
MGLLMWGTLYFEKSVCSFQFLLDIASAASLRSESHRTQEHILLSLCLRLPQPGGSGSCIYFPQEQGSPVRVRVRVTLQLTVSQSVCLGVERNLGLLTRDLFFFYLFCFESYFLVIWGRPLWWEVGSVICQCLPIESTVVSLYLHKLFTFCVTHISHLQYLPLDNYIVLYTFKIKYNKIQWTASPHYIARYRPHRKCFIYHCMFSCCRGEDRSTGLSKWRLFTQIHRAVQVLLGIGVYMSPGVTYCSPVIHECFLFGTPF